jgi:hypothetical protein
VNDFAISVYCTEELTKFLEITVFEVVETISLHSYPSEEYFSALPLKYKHVTYINSKSLYLIKMGHYKLYLTMNNLIFVYPRAEVG